jgi:hypothetical protein
MVEAALLAKPVGSTPPTRTGLDADAIPTALVPPTLKVPVTPPVIAVPLAICTILVAKLAAAAPPALSASACCWHQLLLLFWYC